MSASCIGFLFFYSCAAPAPPPAADSFCLIASPIFWSARDTRKTKEQVDRHNRIWKSLCAAQTQEVVQND
jgi:hypothetical protein